MAGKKPEKRENKHDVHKTNSTKITFYELEPWEKEYIQKHHAHITPTYVDGFLNEKNVNKAKDAEAIAVFTYSKVDKKALDNMPNLKLIATMSTGFDHIDLQECQKRGIKISNVPAYGERTVAEFTMALMLCLSRKIFQSAESVKTEWLFRNQGLRGFDLQNKILGVVGGGKIGMNVVRLAKAFDMRILVYDVIKNDRLAQELGFRYAELKELLQKSDIVTLHVPLNKYTEHILNKDNMRYMKKGVYLINTSRGSVIETDALLKALDSGIIAAAALDVLEGEKCLKDKGSIESCDVLIKADHELMKMPNVIVTPHNAFNSKEAIERIFFTTLDNIKNFFLEGRCTNEVMVKGG